MGWFDWLRPKPAPMIDHPLFGRLRAAFRPAGKPWNWEPLDFIDTPRGKVFVHLDAGEAGPAAIHEEEWGRILSHVDGLTASAAPLIAEELRNWPVEFDPGDPWQEITWEGAELLGDTDPDHDFAMIYACKSWPDAMITVYFKGTRALLSRLDD